MPGDLVRTDLFPVPIWTIDLVELRPQLPAMIAAAEALLADAPAVGELFRQSQALLQDSTEPAWVEFFRVLAAHMERIIGREMPPQYGFKRAFLRSWVLQVDDAEDYESTGTLLNAVHSHVPAVLSSVLYLRVPDALVDAPSGGTTFKDPNSINTRSYSTPEFHVSPAPLRLVVFPAWLEHLPEPPRPRSALQGGRLVVSTDLRVELD